MPYVVHQSMRSVTPGRERLPARHHMPRHRHAEGYATLVLSGAFEEVSYAGRVRAREGDVLLHAAFDAHADTMKSNGVWLLRLPWDGTDRHEGAFRISGLDAIVREAQHDVRGAAHLLRREVAHLAPTSTPGDWPDRVASDLSRAPRVALSAWAAAHGLAPATVSRGFRAAFGVSPQRYRWEVRTRRAWHRLTATVCPLTEIAHEAGFADHAHMTRSIRALTGRSPAEWRGFTAQRG